MCYHDGVGMLSRLAPPFCKESGAPLTRRLDGIKYLTKGVGGPMLRRGRSPAPLRPRDREPALHPGDDDSLVIVHRGPGARPGDDRGDRAWRRMARAPAANDARLAVGVARRSIGGTDPRRRDHGPEVTRGERPDGDGTGPAGAPRV